MLTKLLFLLSLGFISLYAEIDIYKEGEILYSQKGCNGCHGIHGEGMHEYPVIMNKPKWYLVKKMKFYRGKKGVMNQTAQLMIPFAENLNDDEISYLTHFLSLYKEDLNAPRYDIEFESWGDGGS
ncbi:MAG TPA: cytochrome c [Sulfurimonas sp.]|nr:cytochrome c [Sulfurimonas sp.]